MSAELQKAIESDTNWFETPPSFFLSVIGIALVATFLVRMTAFFTLRTT